MYGHCRALSESTDDSGNSTLQHVDHRAPKVVADRENMGRRQLEIHDQGDKRNTTCKFKAHKSEKSPAVENGKPGQPLRLRANGGDPVEPKP